MEWKETSCLLGLLFWSSGNIVLTVVYVVTFYTTVSSLIGQLAGALGDYIWHVVSRYSTRTASKFPWTVLHAVKKNNSYVFRYFFTCDAADLAVCSSHFPFSGLVQIQVQLLQRSVRTSQDSVMLRLLVNEIGAHYLKRRWDQKIQVSQPTLFCVRQCLPMHLEMPRKKREMLQSNFISIAMIAFTCFSHI